MFVVDVGGYVVVGRAVVVVVVVSAVELPIPSVSFNTNNAS